MILVTGATGDTGRAVVGGLVAAGAAVRAMVRRTEQVSSFPSGVDVVLADMSQPGSLSAAVQGIEQMLLISPLEPGLVELQGHMAAAARNSDVQRIVKISTEIADPESEALIGRWHGLAERAVEATGLAFFHLRPCNFMQNLYAFAGEIASSGSFSAPLGTARISLIHIDDLAAVTVAALLKSDRVNGSMVVTGADRPTYGEFAQALSAALGRQIRYEATTPEIAHQRFLTAGMPAWKAQELLRMYDYLQDPRNTGTTDAVRAFTGRAPRPFADFVKEYAARLVSGVKQHG